MEDNNNEPSFNDIYREVISWNCGFPTFEEYCKNPEKWKANTNKLNVLDKGPTQTRKIINKITYDFEGYKTEKTEYLENILRDEGLTESDIEFYPELVNAGGQRGDIIVRVKRKKPKGIIISPN